MADRFRLDDVAQQVVGATVLTGGFVIPQDVWLVGRHMSAVGAVASTCLILGLGYLATYPAVDEHAGGSEQRVGAVPLRLVSLFGVSFAVAVATALFFREPSTYQMSFATTVKTVLVASLFATVGGAVSDSVL